MLRKILKAIPIAFALFFGASQAMAELHPPHYFLYSTFEVLKDTHVQGIDNNAEKHSFPHHTQVAITGSTRWDFLNSTWIRYPDGRVYEVPVHYYLSTGAHTIFPTAPAPAPEIIFVPAPQEPAPVDCSDPNSPEYLKMMYKTKFIDHNGNVTYGYTKGACLVDEHGNPLLT